MTTFVADFDRGHSFFFQNKLRVEEFVALLRFRIFGQRSFCERFFLRSGTQFVNGANLFF